MHMSLLSEWSPYLGPLSLVLSKGGHYVGAWEDDLGMTGDARRGGSSSEGRCVGGVAARSLARVGACADELRLMGVERSEVFTLVGRVGEGRGSLSRKVSRACGPPAIERMWSGP